MKQTIRTYVRPIALTILAPGAGFLLILLLESIVGIEAPKLVSAVINLIVAAIISFTFFPKILGIPFGTIDTRTWLKKVGFYLPAHTWKHILLGLILAGCTLSGMLIASILTGRYVMNTNSITLPHLIFSLNPALWEELFYRGVMMCLLLKFTHSVKKAFAIQVVLFGLLHIKGIDIWALVDMITVIVIAVGFTYTAYKTGSLLAGMVFHYFHDAFLFFVQVSSEGPTNTIENTIFFTILWLAVGIGCIITKLAADKFGVQSLKKLYEFEGPFESSSL
jgi:membrane protease YdiL (CAAX protease family)